MIEPKTVCHETIEKAIEALGWDWLRDKHDNYLIQVAANPDFGDLRIEYRFAIWTEFGKTLVLQLYGSEWFAGYPEELLEVCNSWNCSTRHPTAALSTGDEGDSRLVLDWGIPCLEEPITQELANCWIDCFRRACAAE